MKIALGFIILILWIALSFSSEYEDFRLSDVVLELNSNNLSEVLQNFDTSEHDKISTCLIPENQRIEYEIDSQAILLLPILKWGPTNQIWGFFEMINLSKKLNATLTVPPMLKHSFDNISEVVIPADIRLNIQGISEVVKIAGIDQFKSNCEKHTVIIDSRKPIYGPNIASFANSTGIKVEILPKSDNVTQIDLNQFKSLYRFLTVLKNLNQKCFIFSRPFGSIKKSREKHFPYSAVKLPEYIEELGKKFLQNKTITAALHWRYTTDDWGNRCNKLDSIRYLDKPEALKLVQEECRFFGQNGTIVNKMTTILKLENLVFIAAPTVPESKIFLDKLRSGLSGTKIISSFDVLEFLTSINCSKQYLGEISSMVDQFICLQANEFYEWRASSWSGRVRNLREVISKEQHRKLGNTDLLKILIENA